MRRCVDSGLKELREQIAKVATQKNAASRLDVLGDDELAQTARAINAMLDFIRQQDVQLRQSAEMFHLFFWSKDEKSQIVTYLNGPPQLSEDETKPRSGTWLEASHPEDRSIVAGMLEKQARGERGHAEFRVNQADGANRWMWCRYLPVMAASGKVTRTVGMFEDVTEQKEVEQILLHSQKELLDVVARRQAQRLLAIGELSAGIAHEINTPIQFTGDNLRFLQDAFATLSPLLEKVEAAAKDPTDAEHDLAYFRTEIPKALEQALDGVGRVAKIAKALKEFSRQQQDNQQTSADLNDALERTLLVARNALKYVADVETAYSQLPPVLCNLGDLNQVFLDLLVHTAKTIGEEVVNTGQKGKIRVETGFEHDSVMIAITGSCKPMSPEARASIFQDTGGDGKTRGLALAHSIVTEQHGGTLSVESSEETGTTFRIRLPLGDVTAPQPKAVAARSNA